MALIFNSSCVNFNNTYSVKVVITNYPMKVSRVILLFAAILYWSVTRSQATFTIVPNICKNDTTLLSANTGTLTNSSYTWVSVPSGANFSAQNNQTTSVSFLNPGSYTVMLTVSSGTVLSSFQATVIV